MDDNDSSPSRIEDERQEGLAALARSLRLSFVWLYALILVMLAAALAQSFFVVKQHEVGLIFRFGQLRAVVGNGWHLKWPYPVEESRTLEASRSKQLASDSFMFQPGKPGSPALKPGVDGFLLTSDLNIVHVKCSLTYYLDASDQRDRMASYLRSEGALEPMLLAFLDNSVLKAAASMTADDILLRDVKLFRSRIADNLKAELKKHPLGILFDERKDIAVKASPPRQAKEAFDALSNANQQQDKLLSEADGFSIKTVSEAETFAEGVKATANSYRVRQVATAQADAATFTSLLSQYDKYPGLIAKTIYEETLFRVVNNVDEKFVLQPAANRQLRVLLNRNLDKAPKAAGDKP